MVDNVNPTSQFHPYQPVTDTPASERPQGLCDAPAQRRLVFGAHGVELGSGASAWSDRHGGRVRSDATRFAVSR